MIEVITISLLISIVVIIDDYIFSATLKKTHPLTSQQLYLDCTVDEEPDHYNGFADEWEDYCNYRMNNKG